MHVPCLMFYDLYFITCCINVFYFFYNRRVGSSTKSKIYMLFFSQQNVMYEPFNTIGYVYGNNKKIQKKKLQLTSFTHGCLNSNE